MSLFPNQINFVLSKFNTSSDKDPNNSCVFKASVEEVLLPSKIMVVSSANCVILYLILPTDIPVMLLLFKTMLHMICAQSKNK